MFRNLFSNTYVKQVFTLASGTTFAHAITGLSYLVITQLYSPDQFGAYSFFHSSAVILSIIGTLSLEYAIILPADNDDGNRIFSSIIYCLLALFVIGYLLIMVAEDILAAQFTVSSDILYLIPLGFITLAVFNSLTQLFVRQERYVQLSTGKIIQSASSALAQIGLAFAGIVSNGLLLGHIGGRFAANIFLYDRTGLSLDKLRLKWSSFKDVISTYKDHPKFVTPARLLTQGAIESPVFLISLLFDSILLGFYGLAFRVLSIPSSFIGTSVGQVFFKRFSDHYKKRIPLTPLILKTWGGLFLIGILPLFLIYIYGSDLFGFLFGNEWEEAGLIASVMTPALFFNFVTAPTERVLIVLNKQKVIPIFSFIDFAGRVSGILIGYYNDSFYQGLWLMVMFQCLSILLLNLYILYISRNTERTFNS